MSELYWITRCDGIVTAVVILMVIFLLLTLFFGAAWFNTYDDDEQKVLRKYTIIFGSIGLFLLIAQAFIPTTKQALIICGVGGTIDYVKNNETAKQLPDKAILALDKYLESVGAETEKRKE